MAISLISYLNSKKSAKERTFAENNNWKDSHNSYQNNSLGYKIKLKKEKLLVKLTCKPSQMHLLSNRNEQFLAEWLQFSPATIVQIDSRIGLEKIDMWANQCRKCRKAVFLRLFQKGKIYQHSNLWNQLSYLIKRCFDFLGALILLIILAPIFVTIALLLHTYFKQPIVETRWCVGKQGKLFKVYQFGGNFTTFNLKTLNKLLQLFNVLKGDMSFVGRFPWSLAEAIKISSLEHDYLNVVPGINASLTDNK